MAESAQIQKVSVKHEEIMNFLLLNPTMPMGQVAANFGVTFPWLSTIVHSAAFQDLLKKKQAAIFDSAVLAPIEDKLSAAAQVTIDAYLEKVPNLTADQLISAQDKLLSRLGYGSKNGNGLGAPTQINFNINQVDKETLEEARNRIGTTKVGTTHSPATLPDKSADEGFTIEGVAVRAES